ncbi:MAG: hypothetical protein DWQ07_14085 [Chloroflexi bacterium]|nr:MAG: hypothetical protein DWQ07_14085 [Chloroflexota bacterium]
MDYCQKERGPKLWDISVEDWLAHLKKKHPYLHKIVSYAASSYGSRQPGGNFGALNNFEDVIEANLLIRKDIRAHGFDPDELVAVPHWPVATGDQLAV